MHEDLKRRLAGDHDKLDLLLEALVTSLQELAPDRTDLNPDSDFLQDAREDLSFILEEMFEHFGVEEEAIFQHIRDTLPDMGAQIDLLEQDHELLSDRTAHLRKMITAANNGTQPLDVPQALHTLHTMRETLQRHNQHELQIFHLALERMGDQDRSLLLENLKRL